MMKMGMQGFARSTCAWQHEALLQHLPIRYPKSIFQLISVEVVEKCPIVSRLNRKSDEKVAQSLVSWTFPAFWGRNS